MAVTFHEKIDWDELYRVGAEWDGVPSTRREICLGYNRCVLFNSKRLAAQAYLTELGLVPTDKVLIVGCGYGWSIEHLISLGIPDVWGTDPSPYIQATKALSERDDIEVATAAVGLDPYSGEGLAKVEQIGSRFGFIRSLVPDRIIAEDCITDESRERVVQAIGYPTWIIVEDVAPGLIDDDAIKLAKSLRKFTAARVAHVCTSTSPLQLGGADVRVNWKSAEDWKQLFGDDAVLEAGTYRRVG